MRQVTVTITFNISEHDAKADKFKEFVNDIEGGLMERDLNNNSLGIKDLKAVIEVK